MEPQVQSLEKCSTAHDTPAALSAPGTAAPWKENRPTGGGGVTGQGNTATPGLSAAEDGPAESGRRTSTSLDEASGDLNNHSTAECGSGLRQESVEGRSCVKTIPSSNSRTLPAGPNNRTLPGGSNSGTLPDGPNNRTLPGGSNSGTLPDGPNNRTLPGGSNSGTKPDGPNKGTNPDGSKGTKPDGSNKGTKSDGSNKGAKPDGPNKGTKPDASNKGAKSDGSNKGNKPDGPNKGAKSDGPNKGTKPGGPNKGAKSDGSNKGNKPDGPNKGAKSDGPNKGTKPGGPNKAAQPDGPNSRTLPDGQDISQAVGTAADSNSSSQDPDGLQQQTGMGTNVAALCVEVTDAKVSDRAAAAEDGVSGVLEPPAGEEPQAAGSTSAPGEAKGCAVEGFAVEGSAVDSALSLGVSPPGEGASREQRATDGEEGLDSPVPEGEDAEDGVSANAAGPLPPLTDSVDPSAAMDSVEPSAAMDSVELSPAMDSVEPSAARDVDSVDPSAANGVPAAERETDRLRSEGEQAGNSKSGEEEKSAVDSNKCKKKNTVSSNSNEEKSAINSNSSKDEKSAINSNSSKEEKSAVNSNSSKDEKKTAGSSSSGDSEKQTEFVHQSSVVTATAPSPPPSPSPLPTPSPTNDTSKKVSLATAVKQSGDAHRTDNIVEKFSSDQDLQTDVTELSGKSRGSSSRAEEEDVRCGKVAESPSQGDGSHTQDRDTGSEAATGLQTSSQVSGSEATTGLQTSSQQAEVEIKWLAAGAAGDDDSRKRKEQDGSRVGAMDKGGGAVDRDLGPQAAAGDMVSTVCLQSDPGNPVTHEEKLGELTKVSDEPHGDETGESSKTAEGNHHGKALTATHSEHDTWQMVVAGCELVKRGAGLKAHSQGEGLEGVSPSHDWGQRTDAKSCMDNSQSGPSSEAESGSVKGTGMVHLDDRVRKGSEYHEESPLQTEHKVDACTRPDKTPEGSGTGTSANGSEEDTGDEDVGSDKVGGLNGSSQTEGRVKGHDSSKEDCGKVGKEQHTDGEQDTDAAEQRKDRASDVDKWAPEDDMDNPGTPVLQLARTKTVKTYSRKLDSNSTPSISITSLEVSSKHPAKTQPVVRDPDPAGSAECEESSSSKSQQGSPVIQSAHSDSDEGSVHSQDTPGSQGGSPSLCESGVREDPPAATPFIVRRINKALSSGQGRGRALTRRSFVLKLKPKATPSNQLQALPKPMATVSNQLQALPKPMATVSNQLQALPKKVGDTGHSPRTKASLHTCDLCGKTFLMPGRLHRHLLQHQAGKHFCCDVCGKSFMDQVKLDFHQQVHGQSVQEHFTCQQCGQQCRNWRSYVYHQTTHGGDGGKKFSCQECGHSLSSRQRLKRHTAHHKKGLHFCCFLCGKLFKAQDELDRHGVKHGGKSTPPPPPPPSTQRGPVSKLVPVAASPKSAGARPTAGRGRKRFAAGVMEGDQPPVKRSAVLPATQRAEGEDAESPARSKTPDLSEDVGGRRDDGTAGGGRSCPGVTPSSWSEVRKSSRRRSHSRKRCSCCPSSPPPSSPCSATPPGDCCKTAVAECGSPEEKRRRTTRGLAVAVRKQPVGRKKKGQASGRERSGSEVVPDRGGGEVLRECSIKLERSSTASPLWLSTETGQLTAAMPAPAFQAAQTPPQHEPKAAPQPVLKAEPEPVLKAEPEPVHKAEPESVQKTEPEPMHKAEPEAVQKRVPKAEVEQKAPVAEETGQTSTQQTGQTSTQQTGQTSTWQTGQTSTRQTGQTSTQQTGQTSTQQTGQTSTRQTGQTSTRQTGQTSTRQTGQTSTRQTGQTSTRQTGQTSTRQTGQTSTRQTGQKRAPGRPRKVAASSDKVSSRRLTSDPFAGRSVRIHRTASEKMLPKNLALSNAARERSRQAAREKQQERAEKREEASAQRKGAAPTPTPTKRPSGPEHRCAICGERFGSDSDMKIHVSRHLSLVGSGQRVVEDIESVARSCRLSTCCVSPDTRGYVCHRCGFQAQGYADLTKHMWLHSPKPYQCSQCGLAFTLPNTLQRHQQVHAKKKK